MALSSILKTECPTCKKVAVEVDRYSFGSSIFISLACGHLLTQESSVSKNEDIYDSIVFSDGKKPRPYQIECIKFAEEANFNCIIADEQGLGKTIEVLSLLRLHPKKLLPAVIVVPTTVKPQWMIELQRICCPNGSTEEKQQFLTQVIQSGKEKAFPGFQIYIVTFDMLKKEDLFEMLDESNYPKTLIIDECQRIKNHLSDRAKAVQRLAKHCEYKIPMSGTPIKNNAGEYFTVLNLVKPTLFPQYQRYIDNYCDSYSTGWTVKVGGLKDSKRFREDTKDIIIRRTKKEVLKDLPELDRKFYHVDLDPKLNKAYAKALDELFDLEDSNSFEANSAKIAIIGRLRHITGISKVEQCIDFTTEFLLSSDRKLTIFTHHLDVAELIRTQLDSYLTEGGYAKSLMLSSSLDSDARQRMAIRFKDDNSCRVMIASTQAAGEGLNLQFCSDSVMLERQWNPANEEQAEARFHRFGQENNVSVTYMIASGTIDEYFTEIVETKRAIVSSAMDGVEMQWDQNSLMKELTDRLLSSGKQRWRL